MIIFNLCKKNPSGKINKNQEYIGYGYNHSRSDKVKTTQKKLCGARKRRLTKKNIKYLKLLGLQVKVI